MFIFVLVSIGKYRLKQLYNSAKCLSENKIQVSSSHSVDALYSPMTLTDNLSKQGRTSGQDPTRCLILAKASETKVNSIILPRQRSDKKHSYSESCRTFKTDQSETIRKILKTTGPAVRGAAEALHHSSGKKILGSSPSTKE